MPGRLELPLVDHTKTQCPARWLPILTALDDSPVGLSVEYRGGSMRYTVVAECAVTVDTDGPIFRPVTAGDLPLDEMTATEIGALFMQAAIDFRNEGNTTPKNCYARLTATTDTGIVLFQTPCPLPKDILSPDTASDNSRELRETVAALRPVLGDLKNGLISMSEQNTKIRIAELQAQHKGIDPLSRAMDTALTHITIAGDKMADAREMQARAEATDHGLLGPHGSEVASEIAKGCAMVFTQALIPMTAAVASAISRRISAWGDAGERPSHTAAPTTPWPSHAPPNPPNDHEGGCVCDECSQWWPILQRDGWRPG